MRGEAGPDRRAIDAGVPLSGLGAQFGRRCLTIIDVAVQRYYLGGLLKEPFHLRTKGPKLKKPA